MIAKLLLLVFISECSSLNDTKFYAAAIDRGRVVDTKTTNGSYESCLASCIDNDAIKANDAVVVNISTKYAVKAHSRCVCLNLFYNLLDYALNHTYHKEDKERTITLFRNNLTDVVVFWPLNKRSKGWNLGTALESLDLETTGKCHFDSPGPPQWRNRMFCRCNKPRPSLVALIQGGKRLLDFSKDFTIALWVKTSICDSFQPLVESKPYFATSLLFVPGESCNQVFFLFSNKQSSEMVMTTKDNTNVQNWRHIAVVVTAPNDVRFYHSARLWPHTGTIPRNRTFIPTTHLSMFADPTGAWSFKGSLAQVVILSRAASPEEVRVIRNGRM